MGKPERKRPHVGPRHTWGFIIKIDLNRYLTEFIFDVRVHPTEFPFKSSRVSDNKRFVSCEPSVMK